MSTWGEVLSEEELEFIENEYGIEVNWGRPTECFFLEPLFEECYEDLGFDKIESNDYRKTPDYFGWKNGEKLGVELEVCSRGFKHHSHDPKFTDIILCLEETKTFEKIEIIELPRDLLREIE